MDDVDAAASDTASWVAEQVGYYFPAYDAARDAAMDVYQKEGAESEADVAALVAYSKVLAKAVEDSEPSPLIADLSQMDLASGKGTFAAIEEVFMEAIESAAKTDPTRFREFLAHGFERMRRNIQCAEWTCLAALDVSVTALDLLKAKQTAPAAAE
jgi:hypothetical protein